MEVFARRFLRQPAVLLISDSGEKVVVRDEHLLAKIGLPLEADRHLPDVILLDGQHGAEKLVFVEIVASDGGITPLRQAALLQLARRAKFAAGSIHFVTAFADRDTAVFRRLAAQLARGTFAWFASEPTHLLCYRGETEQLEATSTG